MNSIFNTLSAAWNFLTATLLIETASVFFKHH
jgi:hypothetical protein